ncbi:MAG: hypothetical protein ACXVQ7_12325 [Actinomycetota bacterium]
MIAAFVTGHANPSRNFHEPARRGFETRRGACFFALWRAVTSGRSWGIVTTFALDETVVALDTTVSEPDATDPEIVSIGITLDAAGRAPFGCSIGMEPMPADSFSAADEVAIETLAATSADNVKTSARAERFLRVCMIFRASIGRLCVNRYLHGC